MKIKLMYCIFGIALLSTVNGHCQGTFQNLDFESATIVPVPGDLYNRIQFAQAFPGWVGVVGPTTQTLALHDNIFLDSSGIAIIDNGFGGVIQGQFTAVLEAGLALGTSETADTTLSQTALVPVGIQSLVFAASQGSFAVTMNGQTLSLIPLSVGVDHNLYAADIAQWAGQTATLAFTVFAELPHVNNNFLYLDSIQFSSSSVPEPTPFALFLLAAGGFAVFRPLRSHRRSHLGGCSGVSTGRCSLF